MSRHHVITLMNTITGPALNSLIGSCVSGYLLLQFLRSRLGWIVIVCVNIVINVQSGCSLIKAASFTESNTTITGL